MRSQRHRRLNRFVSIMPALAAAFVALSALLVLFAAAAHYPLLENPHVQRIAMNPATAIAMILAATALWLVRKEPASSRATLAVRGLGSLIILISTLRLLDVTFETGFTLGHLLSSRSVTENLMSPNSAIALLLLGSALLVFDVSTRDKFHAAQFLIILVGCMGLLSVTGYLYRSSPLYVMHGYKPIALNSAVALIALSAGFLCSRPQRQPLAGLLSDTLGGTIARRLVPAAFIVPLIGGKLALIGVQIGLYDHRFGTAILVLVTIVVFNVLIWWCAGVARASDLRRRVSEEVLRSNEERYRAITEQAAEGIYLVDLENKRIVDSNVAMERLLGYEHGEAESKTVYDFVADSPASIDARLEQLETTNSGMLAERPYRHKDGSLIHVEASATVISYAGRRVACTVAHDISDRKRAEEALRASEARLRLIIETANDAFVGMDSDGKIIDWNPQAEQIFGWRRDEALGRSLADTIIPERFRDAHARGLERFLKTGEGPLLGQRLELSAVHRDGEEFPIEITISPVRVGEIFIFFAFIHDITARKRAEEERDRFFTLSSDLVAVGGFDGYFKRVNPAFQTTLGFTAEELLSRPWMEFVHPDDRERTQSAGATVMGGDRLAGFECRFQHKDGSYRWLSWTAVPVVNEELIYSIARDTTEARRAQEELEEAVESERKAYQQLKETQSQLVQSEKLAGLGQMVAGVAHEINNPLSFVGNNVAVLQRDIRSVSALVELYRQADDIIGAHNSELLAQIRELAEQMDLEYTQNNMRELLERSRDGLRRIQQIVKDLRDFARLDESDLNEVDLNAGIQSTVNIVHGKARKKHVQIDLDLGETSIVACYPAKINQVVMNLVSNAIDASPEGGRVTVTSRSDKNEVTISVSDTGPGVPKAIRGRIFDPFFTTKPIGEGTGLGLSISYGIVRDHGGTIEVTDAPGGGAMFVVKLPSNCAPVLPAS